MAVEVGAARSPWLRVVAVALAVATSASVVAQDGKAGATKAGATKAERMAEIEVVGDLPGLDAGAVGDPLQDPDKKPARRPETGSDPDLIGDLPGLDDAYGEDLPGLGGPPGDGPSGLGGPGGTSSQGFVGNGGVRVESFKGFFETRLRSFLSERNGTQNDETFVQQFEAEMDLSIGSATHGYFRPRFLVDVLDDELIRFEPFEGYLEWRDRSFDLRVGQFVENWGIADTFNPIDVLNRRDTAIDFLDPQRLGELGVRARWLLEGGDVVGEPTLSVYAMPVFRQAELPTDDSRWSFSQLPLRGLPPGTVLDQDAALQPDDFEAAFFAVRGQSTLDTPLGNADLQLVAARGPERFPTFDVVPRPGGGTALVPVYFGNLVLGGGMRAVPSAEWLSSYTLKAELTYKEPYRIRAGRPSIHPDSYFQYAFGFDRVFPGVFSDNDQVTLTVEYIGESGASDPASVYRPFDNDVVGRLFFEANDFARTSLELRALVDVQSGETIAQALFERQLRMLDDDLKLIVDLQAFALQRSQPSLFNQFPDNTNLSIALRYDF